MKNAEGRLTGNNIDDLLRGGKQPDRLFRNGPGSEYVYLGECIEKSLLSAHLNTFHPLNVIVTTAATANQPTRASVAK